MTDETDAEPQSARAELIRYAATTRTVTADGLAPYLKAYRAENLREAIGAARTEYLTGNTGAAEDTAYNDGVADAIAAIGALLEDGK